MHIQQNVDLKNYTSLKAGGKAGLLIKVEEQDNLAEVISAHRAKSPIWVLGFGTNCLISDNGLPGTVILNQVGQLQKINPTKFKVDSGVNWDIFIETLIGNNLWGLEFTSGIPGGVGAAIAGNIAAYGHKVADTFVEATILNGATGAVETWDNAKLGFDYRTSVLQLPDNKSLVVLDATFELNSQSSSELEYESALQISRELGVPPNSLINRRQIILEARRRAGSMLNDLSVGPWTAGSFFKNPRVDEAQIQAIIGHEEKAISREQLLRQNVIHGQDKTRVSAAHVLLAAGFRRGQSWGDVRLNPEHILKIENIGGATAQEIYAVVQNIITTVKEKLGITLEPEVRFLGEF